MLVIRAYDNKANTDFHPPISLGRVVAGNSPSMIISWRIDRKDKSRTGRPVASNGYPNSDVLDFHRVNVTAIYSHTRVTRRKGAIIIDVEDQGKGFVPDALNLTPSEEGGFGLFSTRERLSLLGGRLELRSKTGGGTIAQVVIPQRFTNAAIPLRDANP